MEEIHIAGTGIWYPEDVITNDEIVISFNKYVDNFNEVNKDSISSGIFNKLEHSSVEFIEKASGIKKAGNTAGFISYVTPKRDVTVITFS